MIVALCEYCTMTNMLPFNTVTLECRANNLWDECDIHSVLYLQYQRRVLSALIRV